MSDDQPKISKHHVGQHPALKSFRAFDIIPPSKVKPAHTARPIITSQPKHFDNTLMPSNSESTDVLALSVPTVEPQSSTTGPKSTTNEPQTSDISSSPSVPESVTPVDAPETDKPSILEQDNEPNLSPSPNNDPDPVEVSKNAPLENTGLDAKEQAIDQGDLESILNQETNKLAEKTERNSTLINHSPEFASVLQEFTTQSQQHQEIKPVVAVHQHDYMRIILWTLLWLVGCVVLAAIILDILLDTHMLQTTYNIPHTHFFMH